jgi:hypothetical protein
MSWQARNCSKFVASVPFWLLFPARARAVPPPHTGTCMLQHLYISEIRWSSYFKVGVSCICWPSGQHIQDTYTGFGVLSLGQYGPWLCDGSACPLRRACTVQPLTLSQDFYCHPFWNTCFEDRIQCPKGIFNVQKAYDVSFMPLSICTTSRSPAHFGQ